jgi:hypothetical protein
VSLDPRLAAHLQRELETAREARRYPLDLAVATAKEQANPGGTAYLRAVEKACAAELSVRCAENLTHAVERLAELRVAWTEDVRVDVATLLAAELDKHLAEIVKTRNIAMGQPGRDPGETTGLIGSVMKAASRLRTPRRRLGRRGLRA